MPSRDFRRAQQKKTGAVSEDIEKRRRTHPIVYAGVVVVLVVVVVTFVLAGPGGPLGGGTSGVNSVVFGSYKGKDITLYQGSYFSQQLQTISNQYTQTGTADTSSLQQSIYYQAYLNTALHMAMVQEAQSSGVMVTDDRLVRALLSYPAYLDDNGKFSESQYQAAAASDRASARLLTQENLIQATYVNDILSNVVNGSKEVEFIKAMARPERSFSFVSWPFSSFPADEVRKYGEANASRFVRMKLSDILVTSNEGQAKEIRKKLTDKTSTFEELAKTYSKDAYADKGGDMGWRYAYDLEKDFDSADQAKPVLALKAGEVSDVIKGTLGWMIFRCDTEAESADFTSAAVQADVRTYLTTYEKGKIEDYFNEKAGQLSRRAAEVGFDKAAREAGDTPAQLEAFPINLGSIFSFAPVKATNDADTPTSASTSEDFFFRAFSLGKDQVSAPVVLDDRILVLKLTGEHTMPDSTLSLFDSWISYVAQQSVQSDLAAVLLTPEKLKDSFSTAYTQVVGGNALSQ
jgi:peptidyl-prolyl cis-trans isomerase D